MSDDRPSVLNARDDLRELAERYETVAALDLTPVTVGAGRTPPGSRLPPGMQEILDADEIRRVLTAVDDWARFLVDVLVDECQATAPEPTPARLRLASVHAEHLSHHDDVMFAVAFDDDLHDHLRAIRRLANRNIRHIPTKHHCVRSVCAGHLVSTLGEGADAALRCDTCGDLVPFIVWSAWPKLRATYITPDHAAKMLHTTVQAVHQRARRGKWHRVGTGRDVRYSVEDVRNATG